MVLHFILIISLIGLSGIVAQVLILRELLVSYQGNELTLGIILANWVLCEAVGVFAIGKLIDKVKNRINIFILLQINFSLILPLSIYLSRTFKNISGIPFGEGVGLNFIFFSSFLIIFPIALCHGALFSSSCKIYNLYFKEANPIGKVYAWETIGTIIGGIIFTYLLIPHLNSFQIVFIISITNLLICFFLFKYNPAKVIKYLTLILIILGIYFGLTDKVNYINRFSITKQWEAVSILDYSNSVYGNTVVTKQAEQYTFFYNGLPAITTPYPDIVFVEEFGHLPLLFHKSPYDILVIGGGAGGLIKEILKHPIRKIDYLELDPVIIKMLKKFPSDLIESELNDKKVNIINQDGRFYLKNSLQKYDVVIIGMPYSANLSVNRFFTQEFFFLVKNRIGHKGILAFRLPGSLAYLSSELRNLNVCILNALQKNYEYVRIIPGDYNLFLASDSKEIAEINPGLISKKINEQNIKTNILTPDYLNYRFDQERLRWFTNSCQGATKKINKDFMPYAVFEMLAYWNKQFFPVFGRFLEYSQILNLGLIFLLMLVLTTALFFLISRKPKLSIAYCICTTGFFGMLVNLIMIFSFQVFYGYLYQNIGMLISIFMAGIAFGSIFMIQRLKNVRDHKKLFFKLELTIVFFSFILALILTRWPGYMNYTAFAFMLLAAIPGILMGLQFPLASKIYLKEGNQIGETAGLLYFADLAGGWLAGIFGGIIFLPILGLFNTCLIIAFLKISSILLLFLVRKRLILN
jgi:spermidine synthase